MRKSNLLRSWLHLAILVAGASGALLCASVPGHAEEAAANAEPPKESQPKDSKPKESKDSKQSKTDRKAEKASAKAEKASAKSAKPKEKGPRNNKADQKAGQGPVPLASIYGLTKALSLLGKEMGGTWVFSNPLQEEALTLETKLKPELPGVPKNIIDGVASGQVKVLNDFLQQHGFSMRMNPMNKGDVGVVMVTELQGKWNGHPIGNLKYANGEAYPTFQIDVTSFDVPGHVMPVLQIYQHEDIKVFVTINEDELPGLQAPQLAAKLTPTDKAKIDKRIQSAALPKVDKNVSAAIDWLLGMSNNKGDHIMQALAQTMLQMNEGGFRAKEAVALAGAKSLNFGPGKYYHVDRPFLLWATKEGLSYPLFATRVDYESFKDPGNFQGGN